MKPKVPCQELSPGDDDTNHGWSGRYDVLGQRTPQCLRRRDYLCIETKIMMRSSQIIVLFGFGEM